MRRTKAAPSRRKLAGLNRDLDRVVEQIAKKEAELGSIDEQRKLQQAKLRQARAAGNRAGERAANDELARLRSGEAYTRKHLRKMRLYRDSVLREINAGSLDGSLSPNQPRGRGTRPAA